MLTITMPILVTYESSFPRPLGEVVLDDGNRIRVALGADGVAIERLPGPGAAGELLFQASPDLAAWIAVSFQEGRDQAVSLLDIFLDLVMSLGSPAAIKSAFAAAAAAKQRHLGG
jgi:hypothetical protein